MRMQIFRVKKPSSKILKTKNCVPFEVQYTSNTGDSTIFTLLTKSYSERDEQEWICNYEHFHVSDYMRLHNSRKVAFN